jgi:general secretion pathway protein A
VGQPELDETLDSHDLRQLGQRITLSCRLLPLTFRETTDYIKHRINIAACKVKTRFSVLALRAVYTYSGGIPRLINIACDRALLTAFTLDQKSVSWKAARCAIRELTRRERLKKKPFPQKAWAGLSFLLLVSAATLFFLYPPDRPGTRVWGPSSNKIVDTSMPIKIPPPLLPATPKPTPEALPSETIDLPPSKAPAASDVGPSGPEKTESTTTKPATNELPTKTALPSPPDRQGLRDKFQGMNIFKSRGNALRTVLKLWQTNTKISPYPQRLADNYDFFRIASEQNGFSLLRLKADLSLVKAFNLPAILELKPLTKASLKYSALVKIEGSGVCLQNGPGRETITLKEKELEQYWTGRVYIPWKNFSNFTGVAPITSPPETILALKNHLKAMGFDNIADNPDYDAVTRGAIQTIQKKYGLKPDGFVGPMTKIILYNQFESWEIPHLEGN